MTLESRSTAWMASRLIGDFVAALPRPARELQALLAATGLLEFDALIADKARILRRGLDGRPCLVLRVPRRMGAEDAAVAIAQRVEGLLEARPGAEVTVA